ncbi:MAG TPA: DinB family protein [Thermomicrobiaceae bacterium]|nr:DinB family protein [Thermomicrobiaceae bacterium]
MNDGLIDAFGHNTWATRQLLGVCRDLNSQQLDATAEGTYGSIIDTLWHLIAAESGYAARLTGEKPSFDADADEPPSIEEMETYVDELSDRWERFLSQPFDAERIFRIPWDSPDHIYDVPAGVVLAQVIHHGTDHRSQICTDLTVIGIEPPEMGVWEYAADSGRAHPTEG